MDNADEVDELEQLAISSGTSQTVSGQQTINGIERLRPRPGGPDDDATDSELFRKAIRAFTEFAGAAKDGCSTNTETANDLKTVVTLLAQSQKRKKEEELEEEEYTLTNGMVHVHDNNSTVIDLNIRQLLHNPNGDPSEWWDSKKMKKVTRPIVAQNLHLSHLMPGRINKATIKKCHDRSELITCKALSSNNSGVHGEKKISYKLQDNEDDTTMLLGSRSYVDCKTVYETIDSVFNYAAIIFQIRPFSYEALSLLRALHHIRYFYGVTDEPKTQKLLLEKYLGEVFAYNQRRGSESKHPATFRKLCEMAKEVVVLCGHSTDRLMAVVDPYCGKKTSAPNKKMEDLEKENKDLRAQLRQNRGDNSGYGNSRQQSGRGRGGFSNRGRSYGGYGSGSGAGNHGNNGQNHGNSGQNGDINNLTKQKIQETCPSYNSGSDCDGSCGKKHLCAQVLRPGHLCWRQHGMFEHS